MATDPDQIVVPGRTEVWLGTVGSTAPTTPTATPGTGWFDVGLTTKDSLSFSEEPEFQDVESAQSDYPTRTFQTKSGATVSVDLQQWNANNFTAAYGGGSVAAVVGSPGVYKFTPPALGARAEKACLIKVTDGTKHYLYVIPRVMQKEGVTQDLNRGGEAKLPLKLSILGGDTGDPWYVITDDPAFAPAES